MTAARTRLEIATENLANVSTGGFRVVRGRGTLGPTGVAIRRERTNAQGSVRWTGGEFDLALVGRGAFRVRDAHGRVVTSRDGAFARAADGTLRDRQGRVLLGVSGALRVPAGARIDDGGRVVRDGRVLDRMTLPSGTSLRAGFLEDSGVDAIAQMVDVLTAERSFESAQKVVSAIDRTREKSASDVARVK